MNENKEYLIVDDISQESKNKDLTKTKIERHLKYDDTCTEIWISFKGDFQIVSTQNLIVNIKLQDGTIKAEVHLTNLSQNDLLNQIKSEKNYNMSGSITYSHILEAFILKNIEIYKLDNPLNFYLEKLMNLETTKPFYYSYNSYNHPWPPPGTYYTLTSPVFDANDYISNRNFHERLNKLVEGFGFNSSRLLLIEKYCIALRLIPLVQKKYLSIEVSKPQLGKTHIYKLLDLDVFSTNITRSSTFIDGRNNALGDFFSVEGTYIIDEFSKLKDPEIISTIQVYKNGDKDYGAIQSGKVKENSDNSIIIIGNPSVPINYYTVFKDNQNIFSKSILDNNSDTIAFFDRVDQIIPSFDCRTLNQTMYNQTGPNRVFIETLRQAIPELRQTEIGINKLLQRYGCSSIFESTRDEIAICNTLEGLLKLLFPELVNNHEYYNIPLANFNELLRLGTYVRQLAKQQIQIISNTGINTMSYSISACANINGQIIAQTEYGLNILLNNGYSFILG